MPVVSELRCDALVVGPGDVSVVRLRAVTPAEVERRTRVFLAALDAVHAGDAAARDHAQAVLRDTLAWLWDAVARPVLDALGHRRPPPAGTAWPRVWWSPTGLLALLPLHAAGRHDRPGHSVLDRVVSSYTPTLRALLHARDRVGAAAPRQLVVALPRAPGAPPLPAARVEGRNVAEARPGALRLTDAAATVEGVAAALPGCGWAHFACHAVTDPVSPSESHLLLADGTLPVREIGRMRLPGAELAYLSACSTARGDARLADEAIHVASAFQLAGYRHVVGTLWPVLDAVAARTTRTFYGHLTAAVPPAEALHAAVRAARAERQDAPSAWAAHVHIGP
jgi:hypothetical protein